MDHRNFKNRTQKLGRKNNLKTIAIKKHKAQRSKALNPWRNMALSSISLPNWNARRLEKYKKFLKKNYIKISKTELILACVKAYMPKLNRDCKSKFAEPLQPLRTPNEKNIYTYQKISTYCRLQDWNRVQVACNHAGISLSYAVDIALRLYLGEVVRALLKVEVKSVGERLKKLLNFGKYQKKIIIAKPRELILVYSIQYPSKPPS